MIKTADFIGANFGGNDNVAMVSPIDIAAAAAEELEINATDKNIRYVSSDDRTCNEVAAVLGASIGRPDLQWITFTDEQTKTAMEKAQVRPDIAKLLEKAKEKLSTTNLSVSEIAYELGFEHPQSFSKLFKTKINQSPLEFRQSFN